MRDYADHTTERLLAYCQGGHRKAARSNFISRRRSFFSDRIKTNIARSHWLTVMVELQRQMINMAISIQASQGFTTPGDNRPIFRCCLTRLLGTCNRCGLSRNKRCWQRSKCTESTSNVT